jgi:transposase-like protein
MVVGRSWRADETYIKVKGVWMFLYRAVDERGRTVASYLSRTRDQTAARTFFRQALKLHGEPRSITLDGFEPSHRALRRMGMRNEFNYRWENPVKIRSCKYLNNIVEQDHRRVKFRVSAMLGFKSFQNASTVIAGIELIQKLKKGQYGVPYSFGTSSLNIWKNVLANPELLGATEPEVSRHSGAKPKDGRPVKVANCNRRAAFDHSRSASDHKPHCEPSD